MNKTQKNESQRDFDDIMRRLVKVPPKNIKKGTKRKSKKKRSKPKEEEEM